MKCIKSVYLLTGLLVVSILFLSCAGSPKVSFESKLAKMTDQELISYYKGINDRLKDIDYNIKQQERSDDREYDINQIHTTHLMGGEAYDLMQKRKAILKELRYRNIKPE